MTGTPLDQHLVSAFNSTLGGEMLKKPRKAYAPGTFANQFDVVGGANAAPWRVAA